MVIFHSYACRPEGTWDSDNNKNKHHRINSDNDICIYIYILRGPLASLNGISVNLAELFLKFQGLFLNVSRTIPNCVHI